MSIELLLRPRAAPVAVVAAGTKLGGRGCKVKGGGTRAVAGRQGGRQSVLFAAGVRDTGRGCVAC